MTETTIPLSMVDLEALMRRVVREELQRLARMRPTSIVDDWRHEGPDDPAGDQELLSEALAVLDQYANDSDAWRSWDDFKAELERAEASGELPH